MKMSVVCFETRHLAHYNVHHVIHLMAFDYLTLSLSLIFTAIFPKAIVYIPSIYALSLRRGGTDCTRINPPTVPFLVKFSEK